MNNKELQTIYTMIDSLSSEDKKRILSYLGESVQRDGLREVITQEELDMIYATLAEDAPI